MNFSNSANNSRGTREKYHLSDIFLICNIEWHTHWQSYPRSIPNLRNVYAFRNRWTVGFRVWVVKCSANRPWKRPDVIWSAMNVTKRRNNGKWSGCRCARRVNHEKDVYDFGSMAIPFGNHRIRNQPAIIVSFPNSSRAYAYGMPLALLSNKARTLLSDRRVFQL